MICRNWEKLVGTSGKFALHFVYVFMAKKEWTSYCKISLL